MKGAGHHNSATDDHNIRIEANNNTLRTVSFKRRMDAARLIV